jgi:hypothetical protein
MWEIGYLGIVNFGRNRKSVCGFEGPRTREVGRLE